MDAQIFHIFRNTPLGRESLLQSSYFCKMTGSSLVIYIPEYTKFLMYFTNEVVQVDLDSSYLASPKTALKHAKQLTKERGIDPDFIKPKNFTASTLPDIPVDFDFMCCPRSISDLSSKIGLGHIGSRVRNIIKAAPFSVLIPSPVYTEWKSITVFFGGSVNARKALKLGLRIAEETGLPLDLFTQVEGKSKTSEYKAMAQEAGLTEEDEKKIRKWDFFKKGSLEENLYEVPHNALAIMGAFGHGLIKDILFGSKMETIQSVLLNNMLIVGPNYVSKH